MKKIYTKKCIAFLTGVALSTVLVSCSRNIEKNDVNTLPASTMIENSIKKINLNNIDDIIKKREISIKATIADQTISNYSELLIQELTELKNYSIDKWNSNEAIKIREDIKQKTTDLKDFVFNEKEINGYKLSDLSEQGRENIIKSLDTIDTLIESYIPDYKDRFNNWLVDKGADGLEAWDQLKQFWNQYKEEVTDEYNNRSNQKSKN